MASKLTAVSYFALAFLLLSLGAHIAGLVTNFWCVGARDGPYSSYSDSTVIRVHFGLFKQVVEFKNETIVESETWLRLKEEQFVIVAIAGVNTLLCLVLYAKAIHIVVGVSAFIMMTLMLLCAIYTFERTDSTVRRMQDYHSDWPHLALSWSFICVFAGLVVNIISSAVFLTILIIKGERKELRSKSESVHSINSNDKMPIISVISGDQTFENEAYTNDVQTEKEARGQGDSGGLSHPTDSTVYSVSDTEIVLERKHDNNLHEKVEDRNINEHPYCDSNTAAQEVTYLDAAKFDTENNQIYTNLKLEVNTVTESSRL